MMFISHSNLPLEFLALAVGTALIIWALQNKGDGSALATFVGAIIFIFMSLSVVVTLYSGYKNWSSSYSEMPMKDQMKNIEMHKEANTPQ